MDENNETPAAVWLNEDDPIERVQQMLENATDASRPLIEAHLAHVMSRATAELIEIKCITCGREVRPLDAGVWLNDLAICEKCAQAVWRMLETGLGTGRTI